MERLSSKESELEEEEGEMMAPAITANNLKKSYKKHEVLTGVNFTVESGTIFALLGKNGAGKTTIINILTTLIPPDAGKATVGGFDVGESPHMVRRYISLTGQFAAVDDILTARENLSLIGDLRHVANSQGTAVDLLAKFKLTDAADRRVATFSGGMRRRLDIAMSLIGSPSIIFLDEPTNGLDPEGRQQMWETIRTLARNGTTVFLTTQYLEEADELANSIAVLHQGQIVAEGAANELKKLLPSGQIRFTFCDEEQLGNAIEALGKDFDITEREGLSLTVATGGSTIQIADIFIRLRDTKLEPTDFAQLTPTLDDAFFMLTSNEKEEH
jgi:ABC-2 type transport system ATP-binding protein